MTPEQAARLDMLREWSEAKLEEIEQDPTIHSGSELLFVLCDMILTTLIHTMRDMGAPLSDARMTEHTNGAEALIVECSPQNTLSIGEMLLRLAIAFQALTLQGMTGQGVAPPTSSRPTVH